MPRQGRQWAQSLKDFPPFTTVRHHFCRMRDTGLLDATNAVLVTGVRVAEGGEAEPTAGIIDRLIIQIVPRSDAHCFVVLPRRWVVERTIAWLNRCRHLAKDWEAFIACAEAWLLIASSRRMTRRIAKPEL